MFGRANITLGPHSSFTKLSIPNFLHVFIDRYQQWNVVAADRTTYYTLGEVKFG